MYICPDSHLLWYICPDSHLLWYICPDSHLLWYICPDVICCSICPDSHLLRYSISLTRFYNVPLVTEDYIIVSV